MSLRLAWQVPVPPDGKIIEVPDVMEVEAPGDEGKVPRHGGVC